MDEARSRHDRRQTIMASTSDVVKPGQESHPENESSVKKPDDVKVQVDDTQAVAVGESKAGVLDDASKRAADLAPEASAAVGAASDVVGFFRKFGRKSATLVP
eukprot:SAG11_NODE_22904_length_398_cov_1.010033_1_plen_103_part_00